MLGEHLEHLLWKDLSLASENFLRELIHELDGTLLHYNYAFPERLKQLYCLFLEFLNNLKLNFGLLSFQTNFEAHLAQVSRDNQEKENYEKVKKET